MGLYCVRELEVKESNNKYTQLVCIVIPVYKTLLSDSESQSLKRCFDILGNYPIFFVCPDSLDLGLYQRIAKKEIKIERFADKYFRGIGGYNELMVLREFYQRFDKYEYLLIYQLDAFVFDDQLSAWCQKGYYYIGAPWFHETKMRVKSGNGGFSLRKVAKFVKALSNPRVLLSRYIFIYVLKKNEDFFWAYLAFVFNYNKVASGDIAKYFSIEVKGPELVRDMGRVPFGNHGWTKYDSLFWKNIIEKAP